MSPDQSFQVGRAADTAAVQQIGPRRGHGAGGRLVLLLSALVGGALTWLVLQSSYPMFSLPEELVAQTIGRPESFSPELLSALEDAYRRVDLNHALVVSAIFGALLASLLSMGEGLARRSLRTAVAGAALGAVVGGTLGASAGLLGFLVDDALKSAGGFSPLAQTLCVQGALLAVLGAAVGLGFGLLSQRTSTALSCLGFGLLGGGLAAMIWPVCTALVLPDADPECLIPSAGSVRLLWIAVVSAALGLLIPEALHSRAPRHLPSESAGG